MRKLIVFNQVSVDGYFKSSSGGHGLGPRAARRTRSSGISSPRMPAAAGS